MRQNETIIIQQEIEIWFNTEEAKKLAIEKVLNNTNWIAFSEGGISNAKNIYGASKTNKIKLIPNG